MPSNIADQATNQALANQNQQNTPQTGNRNPNAQPANTNKNSTTTVAVGVTFDMAESRKFSLDVSALTEVTAEIISVPAPAKLTELLAARFKQDSTVK